MLSTSSQEDNPTPTSRLPQGSSNEENDKIREEDRVSKEFVDVISDKIKDIAIPQRRTGKISGNSHLKRVDCFKELKKMDDLSAQFINIFLTQGRLIRHLHEK